MMQQVLQTPFKMHDNDDTLRLEVMRSVMQHRRAMDASCDTVGLVRDFDVVLSAVTGGRLPAKAELKPACSEPPKTENETLVDELRRLLALDAQKKANSVPHTPWRPWYWNNGIGLYQG